MLPKQAIGFFLRFLLLAVLFCVFFMAGATAVSGLLPSTTSEPGLVSGGTGFLIIAIVNTLMITALVLSSRWSGWKLAALLAFAWYGAMTVILQIETWYFLSDITVDSKLLPRLFIMGLPVAFVFVPAAVWILGKGKGNTETILPQQLDMPVNEWLWKLAIIMVTYVVLYWCAGYYIAWQNPELRSFYGSPGPIKPFWQHTLHTIEKEPGLVVFQLLRALLWTLFALPVIAGSKLNTTKKALLVAAFLSIPQNIGHIIENPLMPVASVRLSHLIETASSTFVFGLVMTYVLHYRPRSKEVAIRQDLHL